jgi:hypothetical protein
MRLPFALSVPIVVVIAILLGVVVWLFTDQGQLAVGQTSRPNPPQFDTTGGQEMRPRWNEQEGASSGTPNN